MDALHVHGNPALADENRFLTKGLVARFDNVADLQREIVPGTLLPPIERLEGEHSLGSRPSVDIDARTTRPTLDRPCTLTVKSPNALANNAFRSYLPYEVRDKSTHL